MKAGIADNWAEFSLAQELQPFVTKCYECNGLIAVAEYVTVISKDEFQNNKEGIRQILSHIADNYLLGDVGSITKNFMNWGYRPDGSLVILDYAYIYRVVGNELICGGINANGITCNSLLTYDENFHNLVCPVCHKRYNFHDIRRKIGKEIEEREVNAAKEMAYKVTKPIQDINMNVSAIVEDAGKNIDMVIEPDVIAEQEESINIEELVETGYEEAIELMRNINTHQKDNDMPEEDIIIDDDKLEEAIENIDEDPVIEGVIEGSVLGDTDVEDEDDKQITPENLSVAMSNSDSVEDVNELLEDITGITDDELDVMIDEELEEPIIANSSEVSSYVDESKEELDIIITDDETEKHLEVVTETTTTVTTDIPNVNVDELRELLNEDLDEDVNYDEEYDEMYDRSVQETRIKKSKRDRNY